MTPGTVAFIHDEELRLARRQFQWRALLCVLGAALWILVEPFRRQALFIGMAVAASLTAAVEAGIEWRRLARADISSTGWMAGPRAEAQHEARVEFAERLTAVSPRLTYTLVAALTAIALLELLSGGGSAAAAAAGLVRPLPSHQWWRVLTATCLHASFVHLFANMMTLAAVGRILEAFVSRARVLVVYVASAIGGSLASVWWMPHGTSVGASGAIIGLIGYLLVLARRRPREFPPAIQTSLLTALLMTTLIGVFGFWFIDNAGHAGGLIVGIAIGWLTIHRDGDVARADSRGFRLLGVVAAALLVGAASWTGVQLVHTAAQSRALVNARAAEEGMTPIQGVSAQMLGSGPAMAAMEIRNLRNVPIESWQVDVYLNAGDTRPIGSHVVDACCFHALSAETPIQPHESRGMSFARPPGSNQFVASVRLVMFSDLSFGGSTRDREAVLRRREEAARAADYWTASITAALQQPDANATKFLLDRIRARPLETAAAPILLDELLQIVDRTQTSAPRFREDVTAYLTNLARRRTALLRHVRR